MGAMIPDYRGGISYAKGFGHLLNSSKGLFFETNEDGVFVSRFQNDMLDLLAKPRRLHFCAGGRSGGVASRRSIGTPMPPPTACVNIGRTLSRRARAFDSGFAISPNPCCFP